MVEKVRETHNSSTSILHSTPSATQSISRTSSSPSISTSVPVVGMKRTHQSLSTPSSAQQSPSPLSTSQSASVSTSIAASASTGTASGSSPSVPPRPHRSWSRRSASWSPEEDAQLVELVQREAAGPPSMSAFKTWSRVAAQLTNRTGKQCRERYLNQLKPGIRREPWSSDEERVLHEAHAKIGNKWVAIASMLPGRTDNCVKNHWNSMLRKRQRREAGLRAARKDLNDKLGCQANGGQSHQTSPRSSGIVSVGDGDRSSDVDLSVRTECATPSGLSSAFDLPLSSGVPSPLTASSPITPKRDAKLQISSLVTSPENDNDSSCTPWRSSMNDTVQIQSMDRSNGINNELSGSRFGDSCHIASTTPSLLRFTPGKESNRSMRRSCQMNSAPEHKDLKGFSYVFNDDALQRDEKSKIRRLHERVGNPLAALAIAASSVPPSPLTPDSRYSATSRSRSSSPERRARGSGPLSQVGSVTNENCIGRTRCKINVQSRNMGLPTIVSSEVGPRLLHCMRSGINREEGGEKNPIAPVGREA